MYDLIEWQEERLKRLQFEFMNARHVHRLALSEFCAETFRKC